MDLHQHGAGEESVAVGHAVEEGLGVTPVRPSLEGVDRVERVDRQLEGPSHVLLLGHDDHRVHGVVRGVECAGDTAVPVCEHVDLAAPAPHSGGVFRPHPERGAGEDRRGIVASGKDAPRHGAGLVEHQLPAIGRYIKNARRPRVVVAADVPLEQVIQPLERGQLVGGALQLELIRTGEESQELADFEAILDPGCPKILPLRFELPPVEGGARRVHDFTSVGEVNRVKVHVHVFLLSRTMRLFSQAHVFWACATYTILTEFDNPKKLFY